MTYSWWISTEVSAIVGWAGTISGLIGLAMTVAVYRSTSGIRRVFLISARVPKQVDELAACATVISLHMSGVDLNNAELRREIARLAVISQSLRQKLSTRDTKLISEKLSIVEKLAKDGDSVRTAETLLEMWVKTQAALEALGQWLKDRDWSKADGN